MVHAYISEIFATIQGEGPYTGEKQIFVRFAGCPLRCNYCDTPDSLTVHGHSKKTPTEVVSEVLKLEAQTAIRVVSLTGGEPLVNAEFLSEILPRLREHGFSVYLETAGIHFAALGKLVALCDVVAMDMKLPSATGKIFWEEHKNFLQAGAADKIFVKIVLEKRSQVEELKLALDVLAGAVPAPLLVLQPATPQPPDIEPLPPDQLSNFFDVARSRLPRVLIMPQQHKLWKIR